ncbi:hypothetical protein L195_g002000 [Trifolium pratense]|uniref:Uncharacterized protein n=1 Tax=Trifolium pratense TaxID=57577 RepID=A0A2K3NRA7_TRIPR|nr:hypothetical protein L195_g002000 [Trifolium pratense]
MRIELIDLVLFTIYGHDEGNHKNDETYSGDPCSVAGGTKIEIEMRNLGIAID